MWKSLRIGALLALAALCALKLAQYTAARSQAERLAGALAPTLRLGYADVVGALDGRVILESPRLEVLSGPARGAVVRATRVTIEPANTFWLLRRALGADAGVPPSLDLHLQGATFSEADIDQSASDGWFGPVSLVPFESVGCDPVTAFSTRDYARMGVAMRPREDDLRYTYDADAHTLRVDVGSTAPPFSTITARIDLSAFQPSAWFGDAHAAKAARIEQFSLTYLDGGYLAQRNRFCAQLTGTDAAGYVARHIAAVKSFLDARGITPSDEVAALYRKLVADGGSAELSSLPEATFVPADFASQAPEDLLRQLNVTLRRNTAQPILMRLSFAEPSALPPETDLASMLASDASTVTSGATTTSAPSPMTASVAEAVPAPEDALPPTLAAAEPVKTPEPPKSEGMPLLSVANAAALPIETTRLPQPEPPSEILAVATPPANALQTAPEPVATTPWTTVSHPSVDPRDANEAIPASAPPPPADSTAALVWRAPTIERLPEKTPQTSDFVSIPTGSLGAYRGERVRLLTAGGKLVEGRVRALDGGDLVLLVLRDGGSAEMRIPTAGIRDAKVRRSVTR